MHLCPAYFIAYPTGVTVHLALACACALRRSTFLPDRNAWFLSFFLCYSLWRLDLWHESLPIQEHTKWARAVDKVDENNWILKSIKKMKLRAREPYWATKAFNYWQTKIRGSQTKAKESFHCRRAYLHYCLQAYLLRETGKGMMLVRHLHRWQKSNFRSQHSPLDFMKTKLF